LRTTDLPFLPCHDGADGARLHRRCFDVLHAFGGVSPAATVGLAMHLYMLAAVATFPIPRTDQALAERRRRFLEDVRTARLLIANSGFETAGGPIPGDTIARPLSDGFQVSGRKAFLSLATRADLIIFTADLEGQRAAFLGALKGVPTIEIGPPTFGAAMLEADTRSITFHQTWLPAESLIASGGDAARMHAFQRAWFESLIPAVYLGAATRALQEVRQFARTMREPTGSLVAEQDAVRVEVGRCVLLHRAACALAQHAGEALGELAAADRAGPAPWRQAIDLATAAKYVGAETAETIVGRCRRLVGTRGLVAGTVLERLSREVMFGALHPQKALSVERTAGRDALGDLPLNALMA
jgi:alkylation response protein AidB-like acyl-CoA dehydrogenase